MLVALLCGGCSYAPNVPLFGAFFPAWMLCALIGIGVTAYTLGLRHAFDADHISDVTTTSHPDTAFAASPEGLPPVPGSPTAAGPDGRQPYDDADARSGPGVEEGFAAAPNQNHPDAFQRQ